MDLRSPSRISKASRSARPLRSTVIEASARPVSRGVRLPFGAPSAGNPHPGAVCSPGVTPVALAPAVVPVVPSRLTPRRVHRASSRGSTPASVRLRRFPRPWRLAPPRALWRISATHAHEVWGPFSPLRATPPRPEGHGVPARGAGFRYEALPVGSVRAADKAEASPPSANGTAASIARATAPASGSPRASAAPNIDPPSGCPDVRLPVSRLQVAPSGLPRPSRPFLVAAAASCHDPFGSAPLQGLPSSHCPGLPPACYRGRRPVPPGTNRHSPRERVLLRSACAPDRCTSRRRGRSRLPASPAVFRPSRPGGRVGSWSGEIGRAHV